MCRNNKKKNPTTLLCPSLEEMKKLQTYTFRAKGTSVPKLNILVELKLPPGQLSISQSHKLGFFIHFFLSRKTDCSSVEMINPQYRWNYRQRWFLFRTGLIASITTVLKREGKWPCYLPHIVYSSLMHNKQRDFQSRWLCTLAWGKITEMQWKCPPRPGVEQSTFLTWPYLKPFPLADELPLRFKPRTANKQMLIASLMKPCAGAELLLKMLLGFVLPYLDSYAKRGIVKILQFGCKLMKWEEQSWWGKAFQVSLHNSHMTKEWSVFLLASQPFPGWINQDLNLIQTFLTATTIYPPSNPLLSFCSWSESLITLP